MWRGRAWACPLFLVPGAAEISGVKGSPQGCRAQRDAEHPWGRRGGPVACAARLKMSGGEAASFWALGPCACERYFRPGQRERVLPWALNRLISPVLFLGTVMSGSP